MGFDGFITRKAYSEERIEKSMILNAQHSTLSTLGFTLFEIVFALGILAIGILGVLSLFPVGLDAQKRALDYSNAISLAEWKMADIYYRSHLSGTNNSLTASTPPATYPSSGIPVTFEQNRKYLWLYEVTKPYATALPDFYRVDLKIYTVDDSSEPIETVVSYFEKPA